MKIGVLGTGAMALRLLKSVKGRIEGVSFVAAHDCLPSQLEYFSKQHPEINCYHKLSDFLADRQIEAVYIATPVDTHAALAVAAADIGRAVLCEKPMALTIEQCQQMIDAANVNKVVLQIGYMMRFHPIHQYIREQINSGILGEIQFAHIERTAFFDFKSADIPEHRMWFVQKEKSGGGAFMDLGCHIIDLITYLLDDDVEEGTMKVNMDQELGVEMSALASIKFKSGTLATILASWQVPMDDNIIQIYGKKGCLVATRTIGPYTDGFVELIKDGKRRQIPIPYKNCYILQFEHFRDCVDKAQRPITNGQNCMKSEKTRIMLYKLSVALSNNGNTLR